MSKLLITCLPYLNGTDYFSKVRHRALPVLLDSGQPLSPSGRYDIISADPVEVINSQTLATGTSLEVLRAQLKTYQPERADTEIELPFYGGFIGYMSYDFGRELEQLPKQAQADIELPKLLGGIYTWAIICDHQEKCSYLVAPADEHSQQLLRLQQPANIDTEQTFKLLTPFCANMSKAEYQAQFARIIEYIKAGDCYQINFSQRFNAQCSGDSWQAYLAIRSATPAPFSAYLDFGQQHILSVSPERFIKLQQQQVETKPIKGTAPRSTNPELDLQLAEELQASLKNRAENLMIVDLLRNDLSRVCQSGSVKVPALFALESYANVHHLVSTIVGTLDADKDALDLLAASFPGGSITGAPKIRAMEIIDELEPQRRTIYCGSVLYLDFFQQMDSNITIRTLLHTQSTDPKASNQLYCWGGGGIVYDSEAEAEYQETLHKVGKILSALDPDFLQRFSTEH